MSNIKSHFDEAAEKVKTLNTRPDNATLLKLYALFKQGSEGDVAGKRPGFTDLRGRAKFDAWAEVKGMPAEQAMQQYVDLVEVLKATDL